MSKKLTPWLRATLVILALVVSQAQLVAAFDLAPARDVSAAVSAPDRGEAGGPANVAPTAPAEGLLLPNEPHDPDSKIGVSAFLLASPLGPGVPNPALPPPYGADVETTWPQGSAVTHQTGDTLSWLVVIESSGSAQLNEVAAELVFESSTGQHLGTFGVPLIFPASGPHGVLEPGQLAYAVLDFQVPGNINANRLDLRTRGAAYDGLPSGGVYINDADDDFVYIQGPGFKVRSFEPDLPEPFTASPGDSVDFTIVIENIRPGNLISDITVTPPSTLEGDLSPSISAFIAACNGIANWTLASPPDFSTGETASCTVNDVFIPNDPPPQTFRLAGNVQVTDTAGLSVDEDVQSDRVTITLPAVAVSKSVVDIKRGTQSIEPPAAPGDRITYQITVRNTGQVPLDHIWVMDSLIGPLFVDQSMVLDPGEDYPFAPVTYIVPANSPDPLTNMVSVTARGVGTGSTVSASTAVSVDIADSALEVDLSVVDPDDGSPIDYVIPPKTVRYVMVIRNTGQGTISGIDYVNVLPPLQTVGPKPDLGMSLAPGAQEAFSWEYAVTGTEDDPLTSTIRLRGTDSTNRLVYAQDQVTLDISNPNISIAALVEGLETDTVLRGGEVNYRVSVTNHSAEPVCNVVVNQYRRDPDTGFEMPVVTNVPMAWDVLNQIAGGATVSGTVTYLVTGSDKDPLHMIFEVTSRNGCPGDDFLTDRTSSVLDLSNAQVNAEILVDLGEDGVAKVGDMLTFDYGATNVGSVTLENLTAEYCFLHRTAPDPLNCEDGAVTITTLTPTSIGSFETASAYFPPSGYEVTGGDAEVDRFTVQVTLYGLDNEGKQVSIKTAKTIPVASSDLQLELSGPQEAVEGDTVTISYTLTNSSQTTVTNVHLYNMLVPDAGDPYGYLQVGLVNSILPGQTVAGSFPYTIQPGAGISGDILTMIVRGVGQNETGPVLTSDTLDIMLIPMVGVLKTAETGRVAGQPVHYQVTITNYSTEQTLTIDGYADTVFAMPEYSIPVSHDDFGATGADWPGGIKGQIPPGESVSATFTIDSVGAAPNPLTNIFTVTGTRSFDGALVTGFGSHTVNIECPIGFTVKQPLNQDDDPDDILGETLRWEITATNNSLDTITDIVISDTLGWGGEVPIPESNWPSTVGVLGAGESVTLPAFDVLITNEYYSEGEGKINETVTATFSPIAGTPSCQQVFNYPVYSPVALLKIPDPFVAFTGEEVTYYIYMENVAEEDDAPYDKFYIEQVTDSLLPSPIAFDFNHDGTIDPGETSGWLLPPSESDPDREWVLTEVVREVQPDDPEELINTVIADFPDPGDPGVTFYTWAEALVYTGRPLKVVKKASVKQATPGNEVTYDYTITNVSPYLVESITLTDDVLGDIIPRLTDGEVTLQPNESVSVTDTYVIEIDDPDPLVNIATAKGTVVLDGDIRREISSDGMATIDLIDPDVTITKTARFDDGGEPGEPLPDLFPAALGGDGMPEVEVGVPMFYCFTLENTSTSTATFVDGIIVEDIGPGIEPGALQPKFTEAVLDPAVLQNPSPDREPGQSDRLYGGESVEFCLDSMSLNPATHGDPVINTVTLKGTSSGGAAVYNEDELAIDIIGSTLLITKLPSQPLAFVGEEIYYQIRIENKHGSATIDNIVVEDAFAGSAPGPIDPDAFDWSTNNNGGTPQTLGPGGFATYNYPYTIKNTDPDPLPNTAHVTGTLNDDEPIPVEDSTRATVAVTESQLLVRKAAMPTVANPGDTVRYQISITNIGTIPVHNVRAVDSHYGATMTFEGDDVSAVDLNPLETAYIFYTMQMPTVEELAAQPEKDPFINTITAYGDFTDEHGATITVEADATASVDILNPNIRIVKVPETQAATQGQEVEYTITVTNRGGEGDTLDQIVIRDVTDNSEYRLDELCEVPTSGTCTFRYTAQPYDESGVPNPQDGNPYDPARGLESREQVVGTIRVTVPEDWELSEFTNVAEAEARLTAAPDTTVRDRTSATVDIREAGINVEKLASPTSAPVGTPVSYTVRVTNVGNTALNKLVITDRGLPVGYVMIEDGFPDSDEDGDPVDDSGTLDAGEEFEYVYAYTLQVDDPDPYVNRVTVTGYAGSTAVLNTAQAVVDVQGVDVGVEKDVCREDAPTVPPVCTNVAQVGDTVTYYLRIFNPSVIEIQNISITDTLVDDSVFDAIAWPIAGRPGVLAPDDGLPGGEDEVTFKYTYTVQQGDPDPIVNLVTVTAESAEPVVTVQDTDTATLNLVTSDLQLTKTSNAANGRASLGQTIQYTLTLTNLNADPDNNPITNVSVVDTMSPHGTSAIPDCTVASLGSTPASCTFDHVVSLADGAPLVNTAVATGTQGGVLVTDTATNTVEIVEMGLSVTKTANTTVAAIGDTVTFTYRIENTGTVTLNDLHVQDSDPGVVFMRAGAPAAWPSYLAPGQIEVRTGEHTITSQDPDPYRNTVTVSAKAGSQTRIVQATETVYISNSGLVVTNVPNVAYAEPGGSVIFAYTAMNVGDEQLTGLTLSDSVGSLTLTAEQQTLDPGESVTVYRTVTAELPGPVVSTVYAQATSPDGTVYDTATAEVPVTEGGILVTKSADRLIAGPGETITYMVEVTNVGTVPLSDFDVDDPMIVLSPPPAQPLLPGQSFLMSGTYTVPASAYPPSMSNTVTVTAASSNGPVEDSDSVSVTIVDDPAAATVVLTKEASTQRAQPGDTVTYTLRVQNVGSDPDPVSVTIEDPPGAPLAVTIPPLVPGNMATVTYTATVPGDIVTTEHTNTARVLVGGEVRDSASATILVDLLELTKTVITPSPVGPGDLVNYQFEVTSLTTGTVTGVTLIDPAITTWTAALPEEVPPTGATATGSLVIPADYDGETFENTAALLIDGEVVDESTASIEVSDFEVDLLSITQQPGNLTLLQTGEYVDIVFGVRNDGDVPITDFDYVVRVDGDVVSCTHLDPALKPTTLGAGVNLTLSCQYLPPVGAGNNANLTPEISVTAGGTRGAATVSGTDAMTVQLVDLVLDVEFVIEPNPAQPGDELTYSLILTNEGASPIGCDETVDENALCHFGPSSRSVDGDDDLFKHDMFTDGSDDPADDDMKIIRNTVLQPGESQTFIASRTREVSAGEVTTAYTVSVEGGYSPSDPAFPDDDGLRANADEFTTSDDFTVVFEIEQAELEVSASVTPVNPAYGETVRFDVFVENTGTIPLNNLLATYTITPVGSTRGLMLVSGHADRSAQEITGSLTLSRPDLDPDMIASGILVKVEDQTQPYVFQVDVTGTDLGENVVTASVDVTITPLAGATPTPTPAPGLDPNATEPIVSKAASASTAQPGEPITWTVMVRNGGTVPMTNVTIQDQVPGSLTLSSATVDRGTSFVDGQTITVSTGTLEAGATVTLTLYTLVSDTVQTPATISNTACAARDGSEEVCSTASVNVGPGAITLPATGIRSSSLHGGWRLDGLLGVLLAGGLMLVLSAQVSNRRMLVAVMFVLLVLIIVAAGVALLLTRDDDEPESTSGAVPGPTVAPDETAPAGDGGLVFEFPPTATPYVPPEPAGIRALMIPKLAGQFRGPIPIVEIPFENRQWDVSGLGNYIGWLEGTTWLAPGWGNTVLAAHVQLGAENPGPFWGLGELESGDEIIVVEGEAEHTFLVTNTRKVEPGDWTVTAPTDGQTLTLITCTDWNNARGVFAQRLVVQAVPAQS